MSGAIPLLPLHAFVAWKGPLYFTAAIESFIWTRRNADQKYLGSFKMWCWRRVVKVSWTGRVSNEETLHSQRGNIK
jgi:hypothetical protein